MFTVGLTLSERCIHAGRHMSIPPQSICVCVLIGLQLSNRTEVFDGMVVRREICTFPVSLQVYVTAAGCQRSTMDPITFQTGTQLLKHSQHTKHVNS